MTNVWRTVPFAEALTDETGGNVKTLQSDFRPAGKYAIVDQGKDLIAGFTDDEGSLCQSMLPVIVFGDHTKAVKFVDFPFGLGADGTKVLRAREGFDPKYLFYFLRTVRLPDAGYSRHFKYLREIDVPYPRLAEQRRIAAILDAADALRQKRRRALSLLDQLSQSIFIDMFGKKPMASRQYEIARVEEVGRVQLGRQRAPQYQTGKFRRPYVRVANVFEDRISTDDILEMDFDDHDFEAYRLEDGDILLNEGQSTELVGRPAMWRGEIEDCCFQNTLVRFQVDSARVDPHFALAVFIRYFRTGEFSKISSKTSSVAHLGAGRFAAMPFPVPPLQEQKVFAERSVAVRMLRVRQLVALTESDRLFASVQHRAFRGEL